RHSMIDTVREIETAEGISLRLRAAGALPRAQAWVLDLLLRGVFFLVAMIPLSIFGVAGNGLAMLLLFALMWAYGVVCEVWMDGQTPGKRALGLRVVHADGTPVTWLPSVVRNLLPGQQVPAVSALPLPLALSADEQAALVDYAERAGQLTVQRQEELANLLTPLTGLRDTAAIRQLVAHVNWLLGRA